jgi:thiosulfate dehydrogenase
MDKKQLRYIAFILFAVVIIGLVVFFNHLHGLKNRGNIVSHSAEMLWKAPDINLLPATAENQLIMYGRELIANTSSYLGPKGTVSKISNGMNCQNCHLDAGARPYGNTFAKVASSYPKYRERSGRIESIKFRIDECMERSLNGNKLDSQGKEMKAMVAYLKWIGKAVKKGEEIPGTSIKELSFLERAANPESGRMIFKIKCQTCHGANGEGWSKADSSGYFYPPLWGPNSYNVSAGLYRITRLAAFVKYNMPFSAVPREPQLTDEEAWDVAAFVISQKRPQKFFAYDWQKINTKPVDYPFGPFADSFSATQHKYGPFIEMKKKK